MDRDWLCQFIAADAANRHAVEAVLAAGADGATISFDQLDVDTGRFGELVDRGLLVRTEDGYVIRDPSAVAAMLSGDAAGVSSTHPGGDRHRQLLPPSLPAARTVGYLALGMLAVLAVRLVSLPQVLVGERILLPANDPYFYRYLLWRSVAEQTPVLQPVQPVGEPLLQVSLQLFTALMGGGFHTGEWVLAVYPPVAALVAAVALWGTAMALTGDHRVGLATVGVFAVTPMVALRSAFGFADHHAFDVALLAVMLYLVVVACGVQRPGLRWLGATVGASGAVAAQVLAWNAGALLVVPVAAAVLLWAILHLLEAQESLLPPATLVVVLVCGGAIAWVVHLLAGWQTVAIVTAPLAIGAVALVSGSVAMLLRRWGLRGLAPVGVLIVATALALAVVRLQAPELWTRFITDATRLVTASGKADIHEAQSLFSGRYQVVLGPIYQLGVAWIPASIALGVGVHRGDVRWLVLAATASVLALLSLLEVRFTAELAVPVAVGAGAALVWGYDRLLETEADRRQRVVTAVTIAVLVCGPGLFITVPQLASVTYDTETTVALDAIVADVTTSDADPTSVYVLSRWGHNRMYNAFIGEPQRGYGYARGTYESYLSAEPEAAVVSAAHGRSDYIVLGRYPEFDRAPSSVMYHRLWDDPTAVDGLEPILTEDELRVFRVTDTND